ncbi:hypothetical protein GCM10027341_48930 [Spirosoma knui]
MKHLCTLLVLLSSWLSALAQQVQPVISRQERREVSRPKPAASQLRTVAPVKATIMRPLPSGRLAAVTSETFAYSETIVTWTVPAGVTSLTIEARGAEGGTSPKSVYAPGKGAIITGKATVTPGQQLSILVGGQYIGLPSGGGGSFVVTGSNPIQPLIVAGGGGGSGGAGGNTINLDSESKHGQLTNNGGAGTAPNNGGGAGGTGGNGGSIAGLEDPAAGGGGLFTNGQNAPQYQVSGGRAFVNGGAGGLFGAAGFGGGGLGYYQTVGFLAAVGGGGGGYSGGGSAGVINDIGSGVGGGGGSFNIDPNGTATTGAQDGNSGNGLVIISYVQTLPIRYVKQDGTGDGSSWQQASGDLQTMIDAEGVQEVWVAQGLYKPTTGTDRSVSFVMKAGVKIIGGFVGTEGQLGDRPTITPITGQPSNSILSGDLNGDDGPNFANTSDNSYHVIRNDGNRLDNTAVLDGFVISGGNANGNGNIDTRGGAIYNLGSSPSLINCSLQNNSAAINGGAIYNVNGNLGLINCSFQNNTASNGGAIYNNISSPSLVNCSLQNNSATSNGGAVYNNISSPSLVNCSLQNNSAILGGGAIYNLGNSSPSLTNSVVWNNGAVSTFLSSTFGNNENLTLTISYSLLEPSVNNYTDGGNNLITTVSPFVSGNSVALNACSPAINTGNSEAYNQAGGGNTDLAGNPRQYNGGVIDRGAYEYQGNPTTLTVSNPAISTATVGQGFSQSFTAQGGSGNYSFSVVSANLPSSLSLSVSGVLSGTPTQAGRYSVLVSAQDASGCVGVASSAYTLTITDATPVLTGFAASPNVVCVGSPVTFTATVGNVTGLYNYTLSSGSSAPISGTANGNFSQNVTASGQSTQSFTLTVSDGGALATAVTSLTVTPSDVTRLYVKANATGANTGLSWQDAFTDLQSALKYPCTGNLTEIWIARGVYKPVTKPANQITQSDRLIGFAMLPGVAIYGGFEGSEVDLDQRPAISLSNPSSTTLSADIDGDGTLAGNSYCIVNNTHNLTSTAILDGAVITPPQSGTNSGAIMNYSGSNYGVECSPQYRNLLFTGYTAGPGVASGYCVANNALINGNTSPSFVNCVFRNNQAGDRPSGGLVYNYTAGTPGQNTSLLKPTFINCIIANYTGEAFLDNDQYGTGQLQTQFINCSLLNLAGGLAKNTTSQSTTPIDIQLINSVLWNTSGANTFRDGYGNPLFNVTAQYSLLDQAITGYTSGPGNLTITASPFVSASDLNLPNTSPAVNAGNPNSVTVASGPYSATNLPQTDAAANPRIAGGRVDMGALEVQNPVLPTPSLSGTKTVSGSFSPGGTITYTIVLTNTGLGAQSDNAGNEFTDELPTGLSLVTASASTGTAIADVGNRTITWNGSIPGGGLTTITIMATVNPGTGGQLISNQGTINFDSDGNGTNENTALTDDPGTAGPNNPTSFTVVCPNLVVSNPATTTATVGQPFSQSFTAQGGSGNYSFSVVSANLPSSLSLSASGVLSGTPTAAGSYSVLVQASDANGCVGVASQAYTLTVTDATPILSGFAASPNVVCVGSPVTFTATVGNVTGPYNYTLSSGSSAPTIGMANGNFSQNVTASGQGAQSVTLTVSSNGQVASAVTSLTVSVPASLSLTSSGPLSFTNASVTLTATPGFASYVFSSGAAQQGGSSGNTARVSTVGLYSVTATTSGGCSVTASTTVTGGSSSLTVCRGGTAVISVVVSGSPVKYEWYKNSLTTPKIMESPQLFRGTATSSLTIINAQTNTQGDFYLKTTDGAGTVTVYGPYRLYVDASCRAREGAEVAIAESALEVSVLGNPLVNGQLRAVVKGAAGQPLAVKLINAQGYSLRQQDWKSAAQEQTVEWDVSNQAAGVYMLYVHTAGQTRQLKVVKL